jgi:hypothetical protein
MNWVPAFIATVEQAPLKVVEPGALSSIEMPSPKLSGTVQVQSRFGTARDNSTCETSIDRTRTTLLSA